MRRWFVPLVLLVVFCSGWALGARMTLPQGSGGMELPSAVYRAESGTTIRLLLDETNLGGKEIEVGEITFPPGANSGEHPHGSTEIFYILEGELEHVVNGTAHHLKPGMLGFVRPPDQVNHVVRGKDPVKALVIWAPGGEAHRIVDRWKKVE